MKLVQFSAEWCGPCKMARSYLKERVEENQYIYVDVEKDSSHNMMYLLQIATRNGVPQFFLLNEDNSLEDYWVGFNLKKLQDAVSKLQTATA